MRRRISPRRERDLRRVAGATGRVRFALLAPAPEATGSRRDPRAERDARSVPGSARRRYALVGNRVFSAASALPTTVAAAPEVRIVEDPDFLVLAIVPPGSSAGDMQAAVSAARVLCNGGNGAACVLGAGADADYAAAGADRLVSVAAEALTPALAADLLSRLQFRHVVLPETPEGGDFARRLAARMGERLFTGAEQIRDGRATRRAMGGASDITADAPRFITIKPDYFMIRPDDRGTAIRLKYDSNPTQDRPAPDTRMLPGDPASVPLTEAAFVLSGGNGVTNWTGFASLSRALGAVPAGSRMVCDAGHLPRDRQVGASGTVLTAECYFALGISGAPQHLQGIGNVPHVVAVNTDLHAAMVKRADLAIIADAQEVIPALIRLLSDEEAPDA